MLFVNMLRVSGSETILIPGIALNKVTLAPIKLGISVIRRINATKARMIPINAPINLRIPPIILANK